ncbi:MAG TPA: DUF6495 family protein [Crocinitomicaceae bacterium]|nr:DUF6495 family protein [Crocinitomicaceae bacterium]
MKYRILKDEELASLEEQLKQFLIVNGIYDDEWKRINKEEPDKALDIIEIFSDYVLQIVYENTIYLEKRTPDTVFFFEYGETKANLIAFQKHDKTNAAFDLSEASGVVDALKNHASELHFFQQEKPYTKTRELEIHDMFMNGCSKGTKEFWDLLKKVVE